MCDSLDSVEFLITNSDLEYGKEIIEVISNCNSTGNCETLDDLLFEVCSNCPLTNASQVIWDEGLCPPLRKPVFIIVTSLVYLLLFTVAALGNSLIVYVVISSKKMQTTTNLFICNLAIGDLLMATLCVPFTVSSTLILSHWPFGSVLCVSVSFLQPVSVLVSAYTLVAIAADKYLAILLPLRPRMTRRSAKLFILLIWTCAVLTALPLAIFASLHQPEINFFLAGNRYVCSEDWGSGGRVVEKVFSTTLPLLQFFVPVLALTFTYCRIGRIIWGNVTLGETPNTRIGRNKKRMIAMMVTVVVVYIACWLPFNVLMVIRSITPSVDQWPGILYLFTALHWLAMSHTCYNPIILCWMNTKFRSSFCSVGYQLKCFRKWIDSCYFQSTPKKTTCSTAVSRGVVGNNGTPGQNRLVAVELRDETIVYKPRNTPGITGMPDYNCKSFHQMLEDTSSEMEHL